MEAENGENMGDLTEKDRIVYEQLCQDFRQLNNVMWQVPVLAMTLTGGIWFGISTVRSAPWIEVALWLLAAISNGAFIRVLWRLRKGVMEPILEAMCDFNGFKRPSGRYTVIRAFTAVLSTAVFISFVGAVSSLQSVSYGETSDTAEKIRLVAEETDRGIQVFCE